MFSQDYFMRKDIDAFLVEIPKMIRAAFCDTPYASGIRVIGMEPEGARRLCYPLTSQQLERMHRCTAIRTQIAEIVCHGDLLNESKGVLTFHVSYHFEGTEPSGELLTIKEQGWIFVHCSMEGKYRFITGIEGYPHDAPLPDKVATSPDKLPPSPRRARERLHQRAISGDAKSCCWDGIIDILLEWVYGWF